MPDSPKILTLDIETSPSMAYVWKLWKENIPLARLVDTGEVMCLSAKWYGVDEPMFYSKFHNGEQEMVQAAHYLLSESDIIVTYNGKKFDVPHLNREFITHELTPPAPYSHIDLYHTVRSKFKFASNKLDHVAEQLGLGNKFEHSGFDLWVKCMGGDPEAWEEMKTYNIQDVILTEQVYDKVKPWVTGVPHYSLFTDDTETPACSVCGSAELRKQGHAITTSSVYQRYRCADCGKYTRGNTALRRVNTRGVIG